MGYGQEGSRRREAGAARQAGLSAGCSPWGDAAGAARRRVDSDLPGAGDGRRAAPTSSSSPAWRRPRLLAAGGGQREGEGRPPGKEPPRKGAAGAERGARRHHHSGAGAARLGVAQHCPAGAARRPEPSRTTLAPSPAPTAATASACAPPRGEGGGERRASGSPGGMIGVAPRQSDCAAAPRGRGEGCPAAPPPLPHHPPTHRGVPQ